MLAVADDFDRAIDARPAELADNAWARSRGAVHVSDERAGDGRPFDPREHEAIANVPGTGRPEGEIVDELRRGYRLRDRILRPALVAVAAPATNPEPEPQSQPETRPN